MFVLGIDPGASGGLAIVNSRSGELMDGMRMPTLKLWGKSVVHSRAVHDLMKMWAPNSVAVIERNSSRPGQSSVATFSFGRSTGAIEAVALIVFDRVEWVTPAVWKKHFGLSSSKQESIDLVQVMMGTQSEKNSIDWSVKANDGIAEAALIARWWIDQRVKSG